MRPTARERKNIMNYTVSVNESKKEIVVMLDGYKGVAKCCPTDNFNLGTGIELALERAKVAKAKAIRINKNRFITNIN